MAEAASFGHGVKPYRHFGTATRPRTNPLGTLWHCDLKPVKAGGRDGRRVGHRLKHGISGNPAGK